MKRLLLCISMLGAVLVSCKKPSEVRSFPLTIGDSLDASMMPTHIYANYDLIWNDEFNGSALDLTKWNYRAEGTTRGFGVVSRNNIELNGKGQLLIKITKNADGTYNIGQIGTQGLFDTTYGYFECRAKMNKSLGPHVAFWLQSPTFGATLNPAVDGAEIDIFEYHRKKQDTVYHNLHWNGYGDDHESSGDATLYPAVKEGFHTFALEWTPQRYIFYIDGMESWRSNEGLSKRSQYIILSAELNGWGGDPALGNFPDQVEFDYVRVFKKRN